MTIKPSSLLRYTQEKILHTEISMLCNYRTEFLINTQWIILHTENRSNEFLGLHRKILQTLAVMSSLDIHRKILLMDTSMLCVYRTEFCGYTQENTAYRHQQKWVPWMYTGKHCIQTPVVMSSLDAHEKTLHTDTSSNVQEYLLQIQRYKTKEMQHLIKCLQQSKII